MKKNSLLRKFATIAMALCIIAVSPASTVEASTNADTHTHEWKFTGHTFFYYCNDTTYHTVHRSSIYLCDCGEIDTRYTTGWIEPHDERSEEHTSELQSR